MAHPTRVINRLAARVVLRRSRSRGFSLAESLIASVVLAVGVLGISGALSVSSRQSDAQDLDAISLSLARQLMEEVLARPFDAPVSGNQGGWNSGNHDRSTYDNIEDYDGFSQVASAEALGVGTSEKLMFQRSISVQQRPQPFLRPTDTGEFAVVTVNVISDSMGAPVTLRCLVPRLPIVRQ